MTVRRGQGFSVIGSMASMQEGSYTQDSTPLDRRGLDAAIAGAVFVCTALVLWWLFGQRLGITYPKGTNDEGIYLDGARRILAGQIPYRDFFAYLGPGAFWNTAAAFAVFGVTMEAAHVLLVADVALITACLYWITAKLGGRTAALWLAAFYVADTASLRGTLGVNHRWDSGALLALAAALLLYASLSGARWAWTAAGALAAYAAWTTPSMILVLPPMLGWAAYERRWTGGCLFASGVAGVSAAAAGVLAAQGALVPMAREMLWASANYSGANRFPYGGVVGGYGGFFSGARGVDFVVAGVVMGLFALQALVPVVAAAGLVLSRQLRTARMWWLGACAVGAIAAAAPRMDVGHIAYSTTFAWVIAACALMRLPRLARTILSIALAAAIVLMAFGAIGVRARLGKIESRVGTLYGDYDTLSLARGLEQAVAPGESFFAFPYLPYAYFLTQGKNPTRYSYLQPGMMTGCEEAAALAELRSAPPRKVLYFDWKPEFILWGWPSTDPKRMRFKMIESWLRANYTPDEQFSRAHPGGYQLLVWNEAHGR